MNDHSSEQPPVDEASHSAIPSCVGPYKVESLLQKGGMSILYLGTHPETAEPVVIKVLSPRYLSHPKAVQSFLAEAEIIAMADHPNIVKLYGQGEWAGGLYIAMEYIQGISLRQYILRNPLSLKRGLEIILDISYAICHLHTHGVIHRDLKPENILVTGSGAIKVIDFGIAQLLTVQPTRHDLSKQFLMGTPTYMSPEQRENPETVSYPSDIYSLGIISYELILGKLSHGHVHLSLMPKGLQKILNKSLQFKPEDRYNDIVDFITDINSYLHSGNLQKEKKVGDQLSEFSENLKNVESLLNPPAPEDWGPIEIGLATHKGMGIAETYYDFFGLHSGSYGIIMAESSGKGAEGFFSNAILRGMARALQRETRSPKELIERLHELLCEEKNLKPVSLSIISLSPQTHELRYAACGHDPFWTIPAGADCAKKIGSENPLLGNDPGMEIVEKSIPWHPRDTLILNTFIKHSSSEEEKQALENCLLQLSCDTLSLSPQRLAEALMRSLRFNPQLLPFDHLHVICLRYREFFHGKK